MALYVVKSLGKVEEYIEIDSEFPEIQEACQKSQMQFLSREKIRVSTLDSGGTEFPDLIISQNVYLFSDDVVERIKSDIDWYVYLKPVEITCDVIGKKELYWLVLPPRIDCLDLDSSIIEYDWDFDLGIMPVLRCSKTVIDEQLIGSFKMFKVAGIDDNNVYLDKELRDKIMSVQPEGIKFIAVEEE